MKQHILPALRLTAICILTFMVAFPALILLLAKLAPGGGLGEVTKQNGKVVGYRLEGQQFTSDAYFQGRPSAAGYNAAGSSGSNKGPSNPDYLKQVSDRIDSFCVHNPGIAKAEIPSDLVTASGSGLDPDISVQAALIQVKRVAKERGVNEAGLTAIVQKQVRHPFLGMFGTSGVNVLELNLALDAFTKKQ